MKTVGLIILGAFVIAILEIIGLPPIIVRPVVFFFIGAMLLSLWKKRA